MAKETIPMSVFQKILVFMACAVIGGTATAFVTMQGNITELVKSNAVMSVQISHAIEQTNKHLTEDKVTEPAHVLAIVHGIE